MKIKDRVREILVKNEGNVQQYTYDYERKFQALCIALDEALEKCSCGEKGTIEPKKAEVKQEVKRVEVKTEAPKVKLEKAEEPKVEPKIEKAEEPKIEKAEEPEPESTIPSWDSTPKKSNKKSRK